MFPAEAAQLLERALLEWADGRYYEAHEILEDVAECFEEDDPSFDIALALTRAAACLHKLDNDVGAAAVPGKLATALVTLRTAPPDWGGLDMPALIAAFEHLPPGGPYPVPRRSPAAGPLH